MFLAPGEVVGFRYSGGTGQQPAEPLSIFNHPGERMTNCTLAPVQQS